MADFTQQELKIARWIGMAVLSLSGLMTITGAICLKREIGTPEYVVSLRNTGWTLLAISALWTMLTLIKKPAH